MMDCERAPHKHRFCNRAVRTNTGDCRRKRRRVSRRQCDDSSSSSRRREPTAGGVVCSAQQHVWCVLSSPVWAAWPLRVCVWGGGGGAAAARRASVRPVHTSACDTPVLHAWSARKLLVCSRPHTPAAASCVHVHACRWRGQPCRARREPVRAREANTCVSRLVARAFAPWLAAGTVVRSSESATAQVPCACRPCTPRPPTRTHTRAGSARRRRATGTG
jgi:hypothetical protein